MGEKLTCFVCKTDFRIPGHHPFLSVYGEELIIKCIRCGRVNPVKIIGGNQVVNDKDREAGWTK